MRRLPLWTASALALFAMPGAVEASGDFGCYPTWNLNSASYDCANRAILAPGNDTRVNLALLLRDKAGLSRPGDLDYVKPDYWVSDFGHVFFDWQLLQSTFFPNYDKAENNVYEGSRCSTLTSGAEAYKDALMSAKRVADDERSALVDAERRLT